MRQQHDHCWSGIGGAVSGSIDRAVNRVIETMYERVGDELTVDEMARTAMYSKFHFSRAFRQVTGVSPGRFLAALRFQEAKRLLTDTSLSVAEISNQVGYSSLGTFSTRFKNSVGVSPTEYRRSGGRCRANGARTGCGPGPDAVAATIRGTVVNAAAGTDYEHIFVGLFPGTLPQGPPLRSALLSRPGLYVLEDVPEGSWFVLAYGVGHMGTAPGAEPVGYPAGSIGCLGPLRVRSDTTVSASDLVLRPMRAVDLPPVSAPFVTHPMDVRRPKPPSAGAHANHRLRWIK
jgi:AraC-like DNA-binding protein